uniref:EB domain-containing protein n=1 Tax=Panagrellus redivivus TaxID=6233 RepID=A0A7E4W6G6_PANRE
MCYRDTLILVISLVCFFTLPETAYGAFDVPCTQKLVGSKCLFDEECYGVNTVCRDGRCTCPTNFEEFDVNERITVCRLAPSNIGDSCQRDCKPPLLCRDGKCECWGGSVINGKCTVPCPIGQQLYGVECTRVAHWGQPCDKDGHCVDPFTSCTAGTCQCSAGTARDVMRNKCFAVCPDGMHPHQSCRRLFLNDIDMLDNAATTDSCPIGFRCVTYGSPYIGHCCRLRCPYGEPDLSQSCDNGAPEDQKCRPLTHFCFTISEPGWKTSLCCPKPCRDPTPLYINGQCLSIAHRDDPCQTDEQCEGGVSMSCTLGTCECRPGFHSTNDDRFPTCEKTCGIDEIAVVDRCLGKINLGERCVSKKQCPNFADCRFGICQCQCGYVQSDSLLGARCTNPDDPFSFNRILTGVEQLFGSKSRNTGGT